MNNRPMATKKKRLSDEDIASEDLPKVLILILILALCAAFFTQQEVREENQFPCGSQK